MADKKISQLNSLGEAAAQDLIPIVDVDQDETKKIRKDSLMASPGAIGSNIPSTGDFTTLEVSLGATINEFSTDGTFIAAADDQLSTALAIKTFVESEISLIDHNDLVDIQGGDSTSEFYHISQSVYEGLFSESPTMGLGSSTGTNLKVDYGNHITTLDINGTTEATFNSGGITLKTGASINEFSIDGTLVGDSDDAVPTEKAVKTYSDRIPNLTSEPTGFPNQTDSTINMGTGLPNKFTIAPTGASFDYYIVGLKYTKFGAETIDLSDDQGLHYIYYDGAILSESIVFDISFLKDKAYVAAVYWDTTANVHIYLGEERHGLVMDWATHAYLHTTRGTVWSSGLALTDIVADGTGDVNIDCQLGYGQGVIYDEDIRLDILEVDPPAAVPIFYQLNSTGEWKLKTATDFPVLESGTTSDYSGSRIAYNKFAAEVWTLEEATNDAYVLMHFFATNDLSQGVIGIVGQNEYLTLEEAHDAAKVELENLILTDLPFAEFTAIGTTINKTSDSFTNTPKAAIVSTDTGTDYVDWRGVQAQSRGSVAVSDHGNLTGLGNDDHLQYSLISGSRAFIATVAGVTPVADADLATKLYVDTEISLIDHNDLVGLQGGDLTNRWHLTLAQHDGLTDGGSTTLHTHPVSSFSHNDLADLQGGDSTSNEYYHLTQQVHDQITSTATEIVFSGGVQLSAGAAVNEFSIDGTLVGDSDTAIPTEQAVKTYVDAQIATTDEHNELLGIQGGDSTSEFYHLTQSIHDGLFSASPIIGLGNSIGTRIEVDYGNDLITIKSDDQAEIWTQNVRMYWSNQEEVKLGAMDGDATITYIHVNADNQLTDFFIDNIRELRINNDGLTLASGASINEFSTDGTLVGASDDAVPTEQAVKTYVDAAITTVDEHNELLGLQGGDSTSEFYHLDLQTYGQITSTPTSILLSDGLDVAGHAAIGNGAAINPAILLYAREDTNSVFAIGGWFNIDNAANNAGAISVGVDSTVQNDTSTLHDKIIGISTLANSTAGSATINDIIGIGARASITGTNSTATIMIGGDFDVVTASGMVNLSITDMIGGQFQILKTGSGDVDITNGYGALIKTPGYTSTGTTTNLYGLYIEDQSTVGFINDYNIYSAGVNSQNKFEGHLDIDGNVTINSSDTTALVVVGDIHCNDLFTSGSTIHLGNVDLTADTNGLKVNKLKLQNGAQIDEVSTDTALGNSDTKVPTQNAVKSYVDTQIGLGIETGNHILSTGDTTADIVFVQQQGSLNYSIAYSIVNTVDNPPLLFVSGVFEKSVDGFKVMFSSPMDTDNYELSWIVTDALLGSSSSSSSSRSSSSSLSASPESLLEINDAGDVLSINDAGDELLIGT